MTDNEVLQELLDVFKTDDPDDVFTTREWAAKVERTINWTRTRLHALKDAGRLELITVTRETLAGRPAPTTAYRIKAAPE